MSLAGFGFDPAPIAVNGSDFVTAEDIRQWIRDNCPCPDCSRRATD